MIYQLRKKFILIAMGSLLAVLVFLIGAINLINYFHITRSADSKLEILSQHDGTFPDSRPDDSSAPDFRFDFTFQLTKETRYESRYFIVRLDKNQQITNIDSSHIASLTDEEIESYTKRILTNKKKKGFADVYRYLLVKQSDGTSTAFFLDTRLLLETVHQFLLITVIVALIGFLLVLILVSILSRRAILPFVVSAERQKEFITNAGHEIKTPLTIIKANAEVLKMTGGESEWLDSIQHQTDRLDVLVKNLLVLAKTEEEPTAAAYTNFSLSELVQDMANSFKPLAASDAKKLQLNIQQDVNFTGDKENIRQLISILMDNAVKYSVSDSQLTVELTEKGKEVLLKVSNQVASDEKIELDRLFDRFYRADDSRNQSAGGYGIGLSIARAVVKNHKGTITASQKADQLTFSVTLPKIKNASKKT